MGKALARAKKAKQSGRNILQKFEWNGHVFKPGMKVIWNWYSHGSPKSDAAGRYYDKIKCLFMDENGEVFAEIADSWNKHCYRITQRDDFGMRMDFRPHTVRPRYSQDYPVK